MVSTILFFFISLLDVWWYLLYIIKDDTHEGLRGLWNSLTNEDLILKQWKN